MRQVIIYAGEDGYWVAECPSLPGCISQGRTKEEAIGKYWDMYYSWVLLSRSCPNGLMRQ